MKKSLSVILGSALLLAGSYSMAAKLGEMATKFVPDSKVVHEEKNEVKLQSSSGSVIEVEFKRGGEFKEASGANADKDQFLPPENLMPLQNVVESLKKAGKSPVGKWSLEKGMLTGWVYEFKTFENGKEMEHIVDAKTAEIKKSKEDK